VSFPEALTGSGSVETAAWQSDPASIAVLSSGGKDSLLTFGLLEELGCQPWSVFVNESGRHWYTALNAYRHLRSTRPSTTLRVWTTADRVFSWMLRHLPFVRQDFARVRSDDYPVRLWTVAVFLFGALPLLKAHRIGRITVGDEYDTTRKAVHDGIAHNDGLFDQSRYFDEALSRYYRRKGWPLCQFSVLRQMSELLIEKVLIQRYPELFRNQVSCHAAHVKGERVYPCGRCEKCRRIVGMVKALDADPEECGYTQSQVAYCLEALAREGVHQEKAGAWHLGWLLREKKLIPTESRGLGALRECPEVLQLRFHPEYSAGNEMPLDLRQRIFEILLQHSSGAVERKGRMWVPLDLLNSPIRLQPAGFSPPRAKTKNSSSREKTGAFFLLGEMTWPRAKSRLRESDTALLPVGSIEQHGHHLPLDVDAWDADYLCRRVAETCSDPKPIVLPLIPYGVSYHHEDFPGTVSIRPETLSRLVYEVGVSAARNGITKLVIVNGHGGNAPSLQLAAQTINRDARIFTCVDTGETSDADIAELCDTPNDVHAGEIETSTALAARPHLVDMQKAKSFVPRFSSQYLNFSSRRSVEWYAYTAKISPSGVLGDPLKASREKGQKIWSLMIEHLKNFVEMIKSMSLQEIYEKRL
jgi:creatinine amidohydrolase/Fe(II)-dependent formamide hydrolase-like protein